MWLFGSRVNDAERGGDIDLYIETHEKATDVITKKIAFINDLWRALGDQKIDVVINVLSAISLPIHQIAKRTGVKLIAEEK